MYRNYLITAFRNLKREKVYALLNVFGLALGIGCAVVLFKIITYEMSFDDFQTNKERIVRIVNETVYTSNTRKGAEVPSPLGRSLRNDYPDLPAVAMTSYFSGLGIQVNITDNLGEVKRFVEKNAIAFAESEIFEIIDVEVIAGLNQRILDEHNSVVLSRELVEKYFGITEAHGQVLGREINLANVHDLKIVGVIEDSPENTNFPFKMITHFENLEGFNPYYKRDSWMTMNGGTNCYVLLPPGMGLVDFERGLNDVVDKYHQQQEEYHYLLKAQPLSDIHFNTDYSTYGVRPVDREVLLILAMIGGFLVVIACVNFINLATAQAVGRSKEIGIRKVLGGQRFQLARQFLGETLMISLLAMFFSLGIAEVLFVNLTEILGYRLHLDLIGDPTIMWFIVILTGVVALLSGYYPAMLLSGLNPVRALKAKLSGRQVSGGLSLRRGLVIFQFVISQAFITGTIVVSNQLDFFRTKELGFDTEAVVSSYIPDTDQDKMSRMRNYLTSNPKIENVTFSLGNPTANINNTSYFSYDPSGPENRYHVNVKDVDENYLDVFGIRLLAGRNFVKDEPGNNVLVNEQLIRLIGIYDPAQAIGEVIDPYQRSTVIGVIEDFHFYSLHADLDPMIVRYAPWDFREVAIRLSSTSDYGTTRKFIEEAWQQTYPEYVSNFRFVDEELNDYYQEEQKIADLFNVFAFVAVFISCLGLYGLVSFMANQKTKEIGIRKVLGATIWNILRIFSSELVYLLVVASVIAMPMAYLLMTNWLDNFSYHITIGPEIFLVASSVILVITLATISYKSIAASIVNPVEVLKDE